MHKNKKIPIALTLTGVLTVGTVATAGYINNIKSDLSTANAQIEKLKKDNSKHKEVIDKLTGELEVSIKESVELKTSNDELTKRVKSLEKQLNRKEFPTQSINTRAMGTPVKMTMTFYGDFAHENGGYAGIDCNGNKLVAGTVASNYYPQGTQFEFNGQIFTVRDRGSSSFNSANRLDVFVPRLKNESDSSYSKRIREYGRRTVTMYRR